MAIDWGEVFKTLGSAAIVVTALGFIAKTAIDHVFRRDLDTHKANLKREADEELAGARARVDHELIDARSRVDHELAESRARTDAALVYLKAETDQQLESLKTTLATQTARTDRIRQEVLRWANPILGSVEELRYRLRNILDDKAYVALSLTPPGRIDPEWSIRYDYFLPSTIYLFCQYFCWVRLLQEKLSFELFEKHHQKDALFAKIYAVGGKLSDYPLAELRDIRGTGDCQVFNLQQRALGESVAVSDEATLRCMRYSEFMAKWSDPMFRSLLDPMLRFIDHVQPENAHRWKRLELMTKALEELATECQNLLRTENR